MPNHSGDFLNDPRVQAFIGEVTRNVGATVQGLIQQSVAQMEKSISPSGRPVTVVRRDQNDMPENRQTTTPQLLAELNDHLMDLVDELHEANQLVHRQLDGGVDEYTPRRKRKSRR